MHSLHSSEDSKFYVGEKYFKEKNIHELSGNVIRLMLVDGKFQVVPVLRLRWTVLEDSPAPAHGSHRSRSQARAATGRLLSLSFSLSVAR